MRHLFLVFILNLFGYMMAGQVQSPQDSLGVEKIDTVETTKKAPRELKGPLSMFAGSPGRAALYSLVLPGAGQAFNKKYWKIPFVLAAEGVAIGILIYNVNSYNRWNNALTGYHSAPQDIPLWAKDLSANEILNNRNKRRQFKDYTIIGVVLIHFIQVADAFVNRHLIEFDVSDDLSMKLGTSGPFPSVGLIATF